MLLLATKLKNKVKVFNEDLEAVKLKNISINGQKRGCSGFFHNPANGLYVYVNTEQSCYQPLANKALIRRAKNADDYHGFTNHFVAKDQLAYWIHACLKSEGEGLPK